MVTVDGIEPGFWLLEGLHPGAGTTDNQRQSVSVGEPVRIEDMIQINWRPVDGGGSQEVQFSRKELGIPSRVTEGRITFRYTVKGTWEVSYSRSRTNHPRGADDAGQNTDRSEIVEESKPSDNDERRAPKVPAHDPSLGELDQLVASKDTATAIDAAWERFRRDLMNPDTEDTAELRAAGERFLGFLEGRLRVPLPAWWEFALTNPRIEGEGIHIPTVQAYHENHPRVSSEQLRSLVSPPGREIAVRAIDDYFEFLVAGDHVCSVAASEAPQSFYNGLAFSTSGALCFLAWYNQNEPESFCALAIARSNGEVTWRTPLTVPTSPGHPDRLRAGNHLVKMSAAEGRVGVFGIADGFAYLYILDASSGDIVLDFDSIK